MVVIYDLFFLHRAVIIQMVYYPRVEEYVPGRKSAVAESSHDLFGSPREKLSSDERGE